MKKNIIFVFYISIGHIPNHYFSHNIFGEMVKKMYDFFSILIDENALLTISVSNT